MTNNVVLFTIIILTYFSIPNYASAQPGYSISTSNGVQDERYSNLDPTMAVIMVVLVCSFFLMGFLSIYIRQCSGESASAYPPSYAARIARLGTAPGGGYCYGRQGLDPAVIDSFPVLAYISVKELRKGKAPGELDCAVCLSEFEEFDSLKLLPKCSHVFHPECIDAWLASHVTCPVCRANLELKLEPDSCPRCGIVNNSNSSSSSSSNNNNVVTNSVLSESSLRKQEQPQVSVSIVVDSEDRQDKEQEEEEEERRRRILGKLMRSHSTGHSLILQQVNMDTYASRLPEEGRVSICDKKESMRRCSSYEVILNLGNSRSSSSSSGGESGDFVGTPPPSGGGSGQRFFTSVKVPFSLFGLKVDEQEHRRNRPPV